MATVGKKVAIIGAGPFGLVTTKNLLEQGFEATAFERNEYVGGLWHSVKDGHNTTATAQTKLNTSVQSSAFTDFPQSLDAPAFPPAKDIDAYMNRYAKHFDLLPHIQFSTGVVQIERDVQNKKWVIHTRSLKDEADAPVVPRSFDRVVVCTGLTNLPVEVKIKGVEKFAGDVIHSRYFRDPKKYEGKRVIVVGIGATGADTQSFLVKAAAKKVYLSHRGQYLIMPRYVNGVPFDHNMNRRGLNMLRTMCTYCPGWVMSLMTMALNSARKQAYPKLHKHSSLAKPRVLTGVPHRVPIMGDDLEANFESGILESVQGIDHVSGPRSVTLKDGTVLEDIDAIIICSGYHYDFILKGVGDPLDPAFAPDGFSRLRAAKHYDAKNPFPRLYRGMISEQFPESLAFLGHFLIMKPPFPLSDLSSMAIAGLWSGNVPMPSAKEMARDIDIHYNYIVKNLANAPIPHPGFRVVNGAETYVWLNKAAGTGVIERLGAWGPEAWKLWWSDRKLYSLLMNGLDSPFVYRLFDTGAKSGRKPWSGARAAIEAVNKQSAEYSAKWKEEKATKKNK